MIAHVEQSKAVEGALLALMRNAGEATDTPTKPADHRAKRRLIARAVKASNAVLAVLGAPDNVHRFLFALIGLSRGEVRFEASDADVGREVFANKKELNTLKMWTRRSRQAIEKWQIKTRWRVVTVSPGGKVGDEYRTTHYELHLLEAIAEVARARDMRRAAFYCLGMLQDDARKVRDERFDNRPRTHGRAMRDRCRQAALTYAEKMCVEALNMQPIHTRREVALENVAKLAEDFTREVSDVMNEFVKTGETRKERAEKGQSEKPNSLS